MYSFIAADVVVVVQ